MNESKWARWHWKDTGKGRWHAIAEYGQAMAMTEVMPGVAVPSKVDVVVLACGRVRSLPSETAPRPADENCCPQCRDFDDLRLKFLNQHKPTPVEVGELVPTGATT